MSTTPPLDPAWLADLLAQPTAESQTAALQQANLWHEAGLARLLERAGQLITQDLPQARQLLNLCAAAAPELAPALLPQAIYLRAQTFALNGEFEQALTELKISFAYRPTPPKAAPAYKATPPPSKNSP